MSEEKRNSEAAEERPPERAEPKSAAERRSEERRAARERAAKARAEKDPKAKKAGSGPKNPLPSPKTRPVSKARERREREARSKPKGKRPSPAPRPRRRPERKPRPRPEGPGPARLFALIAGGVLALLGVAGLFYDSSFDTGADLASDDLAGILMVNGWRNVIYLGTGLAALAFAARRPRATALVLGLFYAVYAIWGFIATERDIGDILDFLPLSDEDNVLHLLLGALGLLAALVDGPLPKLPGSISKRFKRPQRKPRKSKRKPADRKPREGSKPEAKRPVAKRPVAKKPATKKTDEGGETSSSSLRRP